MTSRRNFLKGGAAIVVGGIIPDKPSPHPTELLRDIQTVRADEEMSVGVESVFVDGRRVHCRAFNVREGWADVVELEPHPPRYERRYGKVSYTMETPLA